MLAMRQRVTVCLVKKNNDTLNFKTSFSNVISTFFYVQLNTTLSKVVHGIHVQDVYSQNAVLKICIELETNKFPR